MKIEQKLRRNVRLRFVIKWPVNRKQLFVGGVVRIQGSTQTIIPGHATCNVLQLRGCIYCRILLTSQMLPVRNNYVLYIALPIVPAYNLTILSYLGQGNPPKTWQYQTSPLPVGEADLSLYSCYHFYIVIYHV